jgi:hypothetical protein
VQGKEQGSNVLGLCEVLIESLVEGGKDCPTNFWLRIGDTYGQELLNHIGDNLQGVVARLVDDRIPDVELTACEGSGLADFGIIVFDIFDRDITDELV